jgi:succinate-semialdehyde dehydrogenase/glutarate-semialdehyde dehydrogenase
MTISSTNPYNGKIIKLYECTSPQQVKETIQDAEDAFLQWKKTSIKSRAKYMNKVAELLEKKRKSLALLMAEEMGKPFAAGIAEMEKCASVCRYYTKHAASFLKNKTIQTEAQKSYVSYQPLGVILAVMPWNFPFWQVVRFAAPTLMAGNTAILKHASNVPGCALAIEEIFMEAGLPKGVFNTLLLPSKEVKKIIAHKAVKAVSLTGSGPAGSAVASMAGIHIKKSLLELGGNDAYLILADADLKLAAQKSVASRMINTGQSCIGAKRIIVLDSVYKPFLKLVRAELKKYKVGDPRKKETQIGPMARIDLRDEVHQQVIESIAKGAKLESGGKIPKRKGAFYPITLLTQVKKGMPANDDEIFGPVVSIIKVGSIEEAIKIANDSDFGLGAAIFSKDIKQAERIATTQLEAGAVAINDFVRSDPRMPFGGVKQSGFGRELSKEGIMEFVNMKSVLIS